MLYSSYCCYAIPYTMQYIILFINALCWEWILQYIYVYNSVLVCVCAAVLRPDQMIIIVGYGYHIFTTQSSSVSVLLFYALIALLAAIIILAIILIVCCCAPGTQGQSKEIFEIKVFHHSDLPGDWPTGYNIFFVS